MDVQRPLYWHYPHYGNQGGNPSSIIREGDWKLIHYWENDNEELYNLSTDFGEQNNIIEANTEIAEKLSKKLLGWLTEVGAHYPKSDEEFDSKKAAKRHQNIVEKKLPELEKQRMNFLSTEFNPNEDWWSSMSTQD